MNIEKRIKTVRSVGSSDGLVSGAHALETEQESVINSSSIEQLYQESLATYVEAKCGQIGVLEDKLEELVDRQRARLQQLRSSAPGVLSRPSVKRVWQTAQSQQRARLQQLNGRLSAVREIKDGAGLHSTKIEELATRKLRIENPGLASDWDFMRETHRVRQAMLRKGRVKSEARQVDFGMGLSQRIT